VAEIARRLEAGDDLTGDADEAWATAPALDEDDAVAEPVAA
jgi:hypothetical protein